MTDALELIDEVAKAPTLDELARRARAVLAMAAPSDVDLEDLARYWRQQRLSWGAGKVEKKEEEE